MKEFIEKAFGIKDSELGGWEYNIPEGMEATIVDNKIVVKKKESENDRIRKSILTGLIDCRDAPDLGWSDFGGIPIEDCIAWLEKQGQKSTWSEEDEEELDNIIDFLKSPFTAELCPTIRSNAIAWLKSLKDKVQPQWKPSEEQIQALEYQVKSTYQGSWQYRASKELLEQLKKL